MTVRVEPHKRGQSCKSCGKPATLDRIVKVRLARRSFRRPLCTNCLNRELRFAPVV